MKTDNLIFISLEEAQLPEFKEQRNAEWVRYGEGNNYPTYLIGLADRSPKHGAILKSKQNYIIGNGFTPESGKIEFIDSCNEAGESLNSVGAKSALDLLIQGGFYLEVIWGKNKKIVEVYHVHYHKYRSNVNNTVFFYKKDWTNHREEAIQIPAFNPLKPVGKQILYFKEYRPGVETYTYPDYIQALNYIESDIEVSKHTLNNAKCGFTPSKLINFNNGEPENADEKKQIEKAFKQKFTGSDGFKFVVSFNANKDVAPTIEDLGVSDLTKEDFTVIDNLISQNIFTGHQVTSPMLFGIRVEGQLGGRNEMREAYEIFKNTYVNGKQKELNAVFGTITKYAGYDKPIHIIDVEPIGFEFSETVKASNLLRTEIREKMGMEPVKMQKHPTIKALNELSAAQPELAKKMIELMTAEQIAEITGVEVAEPAEPEAPQFAKFEKDFSFFSEFGKPKKDYEILTSKVVRFGDHKQIFAEVDSLESAILDLIKKDKKITVEVLAEVLKTSVNEINKALESLEKRGIITSKSVKVGEDTVVERNIPEPVEAPKPSTKEISVKYSYEVKPGEGEEIIPTTRPFCQKLIELDRLYTRTEIETMSQRLGYSVFDRKGGWWGDNPECRHNWVSHVVIKKS